MTALMSASVWAGGDAPIVPADPDNEHLVKISLLEGVELYRAGVRFYDVNALELWADGFIPGAVYFCRKINRRRWSFTARTASAKTASRRRGR